VRGGSPSLDLFGSDTLSDGFRYQPDCLSRQEVPYSCKISKGLPFKEFEFQGFKGKRRMVSFGWGYDFNGGGLPKTEDCNRSSSPNTRKTPPSAGTRTAWSSAMSSGYRSYPPALFASAKKAGASWERRSLIAEPRSVYLLRGPFRTEWEHSISGVDSLRYSITFRNVLERTA
jgi:hypothetical protein